MNPWEGRGAISPSRLRGRWVEHGWFRCSVFVAKREEIVLSSVSRLHLFLQGEDMLHGGNGFFCNKLTHQKEVATRKLLSTGFEILRT